MVKTIDTLNQMIDKGCVRIGYKNAQIKVLSTTLII